MDIELYILPCHGGLSLISASAKSDSLDPPCLPYHYYLKNRNYSVLLHINTSIFNTSFLITQ